MNFSLEVIDYTTPIDGVSDKLFFGGKILIFGMLMVFSVLILIWMTLSVFKLFFSGSQKKSVTIKKDNTKIESSNLTHDNTVDEEIIAVLTAAIATAEAESANDTKFRVVSFKRK